VFPSVRTLGRLLFAIFDEDLALGSFGTSDSGGVVTHANIVAFRSSFSAILPLRRRGMGTCKDRPGVTLLPSALQALLALPRAVFELSSLSVDVVVSGRSDVVGAKESEFDHFFSVVSMAVHRQSRHDCRACVFDLLENWRPWMNSESKSSLYCFCHGLCPWECLRSRSSSTLFDEFDLSSIKGICCSIHRSSKLWRSDSSFSTRYCLIH